MRTVCSRPRSSRDRTAMKSFGVACGPGLVLPGSRSKPPRQHPGVYFCPAWTRLAALAREKKKLQACPGPVSVGGAREGRGGNAASLLATARASSHNHASTGRACASPAFPSPCLPHVSLWHPALDGEVGPPAWWLRSRAELCSDPKKRCGS